MISDRIAAPLAEAIAAAGGPAHLDRLIDLAAAAVAQDKLTVVRYSASQRPEFLSWRNYSAALVEKYLSTYYIFDPFYALWRSGRRPGVVRLDRRGGQPSGRYIADFLGESGIVDEIGVLLPDGGDWALGIFLDRAEKPFTQAEQAAMRSLYPILAALQGRELAARDGRDIRRTGQAPAAARPPQAPRPDPALWPELTARERELVALMLAGHPPAGIAQRLGISAGTVKNHRRSIYGKLDITTERELFLLYLHSLDGARD